MSKRRNSLLFARIEAAARLSSLTVGIGPAVFELAEQKAQPDGVLKPLVVAAHREYSGRASARVDLPFTPSQNLQRFLQFSKDSPRNPVTTKAAARKETKRGHFHKSTVLSIMAVAPGSVGRYRIRIV
jgi:hypothetical protein